MAPQIQFFSLTPARAAFEALCVFLRVPVSHLSLKHSLRFIPCACQSPSQLNVICMLVTGVFYAIWGICMPLSIRRLRLIEIVIFGVEIIFF